MGFGDIQGRAPTRPSAPQAKGVCDQCGCWVAFRDLIKQTEWTGTRVSWLGFLVCRSCLDKPQPQLKSIRLPPDPVPIKNPRPENFYQDNGLQGFTLYALFPYDNPPTSPSAVLAAVAQASGIPTPSPLNTYGGTVNGAVQTVVPANPSRSWLLLYNPSEPPWSVAIGAANFASGSSIMLGPGNALFWANAQGGAVVTQSAMSGIGNIPNVPYFAWDA